MQKTTPLHDKITSFRKISSRYIVTLAYRLLVLQVYTGIKRSASIDSLQKQNMAIIQQIILLLSALGIPYIMLDMKPNLKILFARTKSDVLALSALHKEVFEQHRSHDAYGELLGYPSCCRKRYFFSDMTRSYPRGLPLPHLHKWKWHIPFILNRLSAFNLIHHYPCTVNCKNSIALAQSILSLYFSYNTEVTKKIVVPILQKPVLLFNENNYIRFYSKRTGMTIAYSFIEPVNLSSFEKGRQSALDKKADKLAKLMTKGNKIIFGNKSFSIFKDTMRLHTHRMEEFYFQLLDFI